MSRGHGRIQQSILALIASDDDGAWTTEQLCAHIYCGINRVEKKHRVAVIRALRRMQLPAGWSVSGLYRPGGEWCLHNTVSLESVIRKTCHGSWRGWDPDELKRRYPHIIDRCREAVDKAKRWQDADEVEKLEIAITERRELLSLAATAGACELVQSLMAEIAELLDTKERHARNIDRGDLPPACRRR